MNKLVGRHNMNEQNRKKEKHNLKVSIDICNMKLYLLVKALEAKLYILMKCKNLAK